MEDISLTTGQFQILLNMSARPGPGFLHQTEAFIPMLLSARSSGHKWHMKMSEANIETALDFFLTHQENVRTPAARQALSFFVREYPTAHRYYDKRQQSDVPRETSTEDTA